MKKNCILVLLILLYIMPVSGQESPLVSSLTLYDLTHEKMNNTYTDIRGNTIKITTNEPASGVTYGRFVYYSDVEKPLACAGESPAGLQPPSDAGGYARFLLMGASNARPNRSPYFILDFGTSSTGIREIQIMGTAAGVNEGDYEELLYAFSPKTNPVLNDFDDLPDEYSPLIFKVGDCNADGLRIKFPEGTVSVIFISTDDFGGWGTGTNYHNPAEFHALRFYVEDTATGISEEEGDTVRVYIQGNVIRTSHPCYASIYDLSGRMLYSGKNTDILPLQEGMKGVYLLKGYTSETGKTFQQKIIIK